MTERNTPDLDNDTWQETLRESFNDLPNDPEFARHRAQIEELLEHVNASSLDINDVMPDLRTILAEANASRRAMRLRHALDKPEVAQALGRARRVSSPWAGAGAVAGDVGAVDPTALPSAMAPPPAVEMPTVETTTKSTAKRNESRRNTAGRALGAILAVVTPAVLVYALFVKHNEPTPVAAPTTSSTAPTALFASHVSGSASSVVSRESEEDASVTSPEVDAATARPVPFVNPVQRPRGSKTRPDPSGSAAASNPPPDSTYDIVAP